jgi:probable phosphomutase (TIGR03848 family)
MGFLPSCTTGRLLSSSALAPALDTGRPGRTGIAPSRPRLAPGRLTRPHDALLLPGEQARSRPIRNGRGAKTTLVLLVRHGQTSTTGVTLPGRAPGLHLAEKGREEATDVAGRIARLRRVAAVYASPLERAQETAAPIAAAAGLSVTTEPGLLECDYGDWTGLALKDLRRKPEWKIVQRYPSGFRFPGGESFTEMQARMAGTLARLVADHPGQTVVAVSHADPIKTAVAHALGTHLDLFQRIAVFTASVTAIAYGPEGPTVLAVNATRGDLAPLAGR